MATRERRGKQPDRDGGAAPRTDRDRPPENKPRRKPSGGSEPATPKDGDSKLLQDRVFHVLMSLIGKFVEVATRSGVSYTGVFHTANLTDVGIAVVLKMANKTTDRKGFVRPVDTLVIQPGDFVQMYAKNIELLRDRIVPDERGAPGKFATDTEISGEAFTDQRDLVPWQPEDEAGDELLGTFDTGRGGKGKAGTWDQFSANKRFGVESTYQEEFYTTKLDKSTHDFKERARHAERLAHEIEAENREKARSGTVNRHVLEETVDDVDLGEDGPDDDELYSARPLLTRASDQHCLTSDGQAVSREQPKPTQDPATSEDKPSDGLLKKPVNPFSKLNPKAAEFKPTFGGGGGGFGGGGEAAPMAGSEFAGGGAAPMQGQMQGVPGAMGVQGMMPNQFGFAPMSILPRPMQMGGMMQQTQLFGSPLSPPMMGGGAQFMSPQFQRGNAAAPPGMFPQGGMRPRGEFYSPPMSQPVGANFGMARNFGMPQQQQRQGE